MKTGTALLLGAAFVLGGLLVRSVFPVTVVEQQVVRVPLTPDTVFVTDTLVERQTVFRDRIRPVVTTDTLNLTDTVFVALERPLGALNRLFVDTVTVGEFFGDTTYIATTRIRTDTAGVFRQDELHRLVTTGTLRSLAVSDSLVEVDFIPFPKPPSTCNLGCRLQWGLGGVAAGLIVGVIFGG